MVGWIIYFQEASIYNKGYIDTYIEEGDKLGFEIKLILIEELTFGVENNELMIKHQGEKAVLPDFVICRTIYPLLTKQLEAMGIRVFNTSKVSEICNDKALTYQILAGKGIPIVDSKFYKNQQVPTIIKEGKGNHVIKAVEGHGGTQVFLCGEDVEEHKQVIQGLSNSDVVYQPLIEGNRQDLRVYVIGKEIIASVLRTARDGFKSNYSLGGDVVLYTLSEKESVLVHRIIDQFEFDMVGIDFIIDKYGTLIFNEIEDVVGARMLYQCSDINIVELYLIYMKGILYKKR